MKRCTINLKKLKLCVWKVCNNLSSLKMLKRVKWCAIKYRTPIYEICIYNACLQINITNIELIELIHYSLLHLHYSLIHLLYFYENRAIEGGWIKVRKTWHDLTNSFYKHAKSLNIVCLIIVCHLGVSDEGCG